jgi:hypothetical protein
MRIRTIACLALPLAGLFVGSALARQTGGFGGAASASC